MTRNIKEPISVTHPHLIEEWDFNKNSELGYFIEDTTHGSHKKAWWICKVCKYSFDTVVSNRVKLTKNGRIHCPNCNGKVLTDERTFLYKYPELSLDWDYDKNPDTPADVFANSGKRRFWKCPKGHSYESIIDNKAKGRTCPHCDKGRKTSYSEQAIYYYLKKIFSAVDNRYPFITDDYRGEFDIFIGDLSLAIEYDGLWYHQTERIIQKDITKNIVAKENNVHLIRVREKGLPILGDCYNIFGADPHRKNLDLIIEALMRMILETFTNELSEHQKKLLNSSVKNKEYASDIQSNLVQKEMTNSLIKTHPEIASEWNYEKNLELKPIHLTYASNKKVWWICEQQHEWDAKISDRTSKLNGCPYCSGRRLTYENSLEFCVPELAKEWHPTKNGELTPKDFSKSNGTKVWWLVDGKERFSSINSRYTTYKKKLKKRMENE